MISKIGICLVVLFSFLIVGSKLSGIITLPWWLVTMPFWYAITLFIGWLGFLVIASVIGWRAVEAASK